MGKSNPISRDETFEQYHKRKEKLDAQVELVRDGFFRESSQKKDEEEEPLY